MWHTTEGMNLRRGVPALLVVLALCAGPAAAVCSECCPQAAVKTSLSAPAGCCGDCKPTLDRGTDPASLAAKSAIAATDAQAVASGPAEGLVRIEAIFAPAAAFAPRIAPPPAPLAPLRL